MKGEIQEQKKGEHLYQKKRVPGRVDSGHAAMLGYDSAAGASLSHGCPKFQGLSLYVSMASFMKNGRSVLSELKIEMLTTNAFL